MLTVKTIRFSYFPTEPILRPFQLAIGKARLMSALLGSPSPARPARLAHQPALFPEGWTAVLHHALRVLETRRELVRDIGMTRAEAALEARRAPWDTQRQRG